MTQRSKIGLAPALVVLAVLAALSVGCAGESEADLMSSAKVLLDKGDARGAAIQAKNILQKNPSSAQARWMLATALLAGGLAGPAEVEMRKAIELKHPMDAAAPVLARAMVEQAHYAKVVEEFAALELPDAAASADLRSSVALAYLRLGERKKAEQLVDAVLKATPGYPAATIIQARLLASRREIDDALRAVRELLAKQPNNLEALQLEGDLLQFGKKDPAAAATAYRKAIALRADYLPAHSALIGAYLGQKDIAAATQQIDALRKVLPENPRTKLFEAELAYLNADYKKSREHTQQLLRIAPNDVRLLQFAGAVELQLNSLVQAETYLTKAVAQAPDKAAPRRLAAVAYLRSGQTAKALNVLRPLLESAEPDLETLTLAAEAYLQAGDAKRSEAYFTRAAKLSPDDAKIRTALALTALAKGNADAAFSELQTIAASDKDSFADMALINARLRRSEWDGAIKAIDALELKQPGKALAPNLRGRVLVSRGDLPGARRNFELALSRDPVFYAAAASLAALDMQDKQPDQARKRFEGLLKADPNHVLALIAIASLRQVQGGSKDEVTQAYEAAVKAGPADANARVLLVDYLLLQRDAKGALAAAQAGVAAAPESVEVLDALGRAQLASGDRNQALSTFSKLASLQPGSAQPYLRMADAHALANDSVAAIQSLKRALAITPDLVAAQRSLIRLFMQSKQPQQAVAVARSIQKQRPELALGLVFEGDIEAEQRNFDAAIKAYRAGLAKPDPGTSASRLHAVLLTSKKPAEAEAVAAAWLKGHPKDIEFMLYLADIAMADGRQPAAEQIYRDVLKIEPETPRAVNNLAWLLAKSGKPGAVAMAEKAVAMMPRNPAVMDTLTLALTADKQTAKALETAKKVVAMAPEVPAYRLTLAKLYIESGDKPQAKAELDALAKLGGKFIGQAEVQQLLKAL